jgi:3-hydroxyisobutyrate dehydrogenase
MIAEQYDVNFLLRLLLKDMRYAEKVAGDSGIALRTVKPTIDIFDRAVRAGLGEKDMSAVVELYRRSAEEQ